MEDVEAWVDQYGEDLIFEEMNTLYQKYKYMEGQMIRAREGLKVKCPEIKKTLEAVALLYTRHQGEEKEVETQFMVSDNIWAKAKVPNNTGKVALWLGANVMVEYSFQEAITLLSKNLKNAEEKLIEAD